MTGHDYVQSINSYAEAAHILSNQSIGEFLEALISRLSGVLLSIYYYSNPNHEIC
jgi:hypothetical protein